MSTIQFIRKWNLGLQGDVNVPRIGNQDVSSRGLSLKPEVLAEFRRLRALGYRVAVSSLGDSRVEFRATDHRTGEDHVALTTDGSAEAQQAAIGSIVEQVNFALEG